MRSNGLYSGAFTRSDPAHVGRRLVGNNSHLAPKRIDFASKMTFCGTANRAIARQMPDSVEPHRDASCAESHPGCAKRCLDSGMPRPNHNHVELPHSPKECTYRDRR